MRSFALKVLFSPVPVFVELFVILSTAFAVAKRKRIASTKSTDIGYEPESKASAIQYDDGKVSLLEVANDDESEL